MRKSRIPDGTYSSKKVAALLGINYYCMHTWVMRGYFNPWLSGSGTGNWIVYSPNDIYRIYCFKKLLEKGFSRSAAANILRNFNSDGDLIFSLTISISKKECMQLLI